MGAATFVVGLLPGYAVIGALAPILLVTMRVLQGLALGGEYGGAATYIAEHAPDGRRGLYTSWIQTTATMGIVLALLGHPDLPAVDGRPRRLATGVGASRSCSRRSSLCCPAISGLKLAGIAALRPPQGAGQGIEQPGSR